MQRSLRVLMVGRAASLAPSLQAELAALPQQVEIVWCATLEGLPDTASVPEVIVVWQSHPDDVTSQQVRNLLNARPLSRLVVAYGPWCDSDGRTRQRWPISCRVPIDRVILRLHRELSVVRGHSFPLPLTANRDECWIYDRPAEAVPPGRLLRVAIETPDPAIRNWLSDALQTNGHCTAELLDGSVDLLLYDADPWTPQAATSLASRVRRRPDLPVIALVGYSGEIPDHELREAGVKAVFTKLSPIAQLSHLLDTVRSTPETRRPELHVVTTP